VGLRDRLGELTEWNDTTIHEILTQIVEEHALKLGQLAQPVRIALTGGTVSPPIDQTIRLLGKERVIARLDRAIAQLSSEIMQ
jgi:glutamyl-tRNA synthetase